MLKRIFINMISGWGVILIRSVVALVMVPFLIAQLGKDGYGLICLLMVIISFSNVADLGLRSALGRELSEKVSNKDEAGFRTLSSTALMLYMCIASVLVAVGWILAPWMASFFNVTEMYYETAIWLIRIYGGLSVLLSFITPVLTSGITSFLRFDVVEQVRGITCLLGSLLLFLCIPLISCSPLIIWATIVLATALLEVLVMWRFYRKLCFGGKLGFHYVNFSKLKSLLNLGGYMYALQMTQALAERSDPLVISAFMGPSSVALYQSGAKVSQMLRPIVLTFVNQLHPLTTRCHVQGQQEKQKQLLLSGTKFTLLLGTLVSAGLILLADPFCQLWLFNTLGKDCLIVASVLKLWAVADLFTYAAGTQWPILLGMRKLRFLVWTQLPSAIINILISIYIVGFTNLGIPGVLYSTIVINAIRRPIIIWYVSKVSEVRVFEYVKRSYLRPLACFFITLMIGLVCKKHVFIDSWPIFVFAVFFVSGVWVLSFWMIGLSRRESLLIKDGVYKYLCAKQG